MDVVSPQRLDRLSRMVERATRHEDLQAAMVLLRDDLAVGHLEYRWISGAQECLGLEFTIRALTAEGERVAIEAESDGIHSSGARYHNQYHFLMTARDGKITGFKEYMDTEHAREVLVGGG